MERFMTEEELKEFDTKYQASKAPTANNLGQETFEQVVSKEVQSQLAVMREELGLKKT